MIRCDFVVFFLMIAACFSIKVHQIKLLMTFGLKLYTF